MTCARGLARRQTSASSCGWRCARWGPAPAGCVRPAARGFRTWPASPCRARCRGPGSVGLDGKYSRTAAARISAPPTLWAPSSRIFWPDGPRDQSAAARPSGRGTRPARMVSSLTGICERERRARWPAATAAFILWCWPSSGSWMRVQGRTVRFRRGDRIVSGALLATRSFRDDLQGSAASVAGDDGNAGLDDAGLLGGNAGQGLAQPLLMIVLDVGDDAGQRGDDVRGIQPSAQAGFPDHQVALLRRRSSATP